MTFRAQFSANWCRRRPVDNVIRSDTRLQARNYFHRLVFFVEELNHCGDCITSGRTMFAETRAPLEDGCAPHVFPLAQPPHQERHTFLRRSDVQPNNNNLILFSLCHVAPFIYAYISQHLQYMTLPTEEVLEVARCSEEEGVFGCGRDGADSAQVSQGNTALDLRPARAIVVQDHS
jgi:hypothetical protein